MWKCVWLFKDQYRLCFFTTIIHNRLFTTTTTRYRVYPPSDLSKSCSGVNWRVPGICQVESHRAWVCETTLVEAPSQIDIIFIVMGCLDESFAMPCFSHDLIWHMPPPGADSYGLSIPGCPWALFALLQFATIESLRDSGMLNDIVEWFHATSDWHFICRCAWVLSFLNISPVSTLFFAKVAK